MHPISGLQLRVHALVGFAIQLPQALALGEGGVKGGEGRGGEGGGVDRMVRREEAGGGG